MNYNKDLKTSIRTLLGINTDEYTPNEVRVIIEAYVEAMEDLVIPIGETLSSSDIMVTKEENNAVVVSKALYTDFMEEFNKYKDSEENKLSNILN